MGMVLTNVKTKHKSEARIIVDISIFKEMIIEVPASCYMTSYILVDRYQCA
jgi:ribosomal protein S25